MTEDSSDSPGPSPRPWLVRLKKLYSREPQDREHLAELLLSAERHGIVDPDTLAMMEGALQVSEMQVRDIMIPRAEMVAVEEGTDPRALLPIIIESGHSRFPLLDDKHERVIGILLAKDLLAYLAHEDKERFDIKDFIRPPVFVPESKRLNILLREFRTSRNHLAIVVDEYGSPAGLVSIEDVIEQIVGEIDDEHDIDKEGYVRQHRGDRYTVRARMPITEFNEYFGTEFSDAEYGTIGGFVIKQLGHLPRRGETLDFGGFNFKVLRADRRRLHTLRVIRQHRDHRPGVTTGA